MGKAADDAAAKKAANDAAAKKAADEASAKKAADEAVATKAADDAAAKSKSAGASPSQKEDSPAKKGKPRWLVIGGGDKGSIMVREGQGLKSAELRRLATGAKVEELELTED